MSSTMVPLANTDCALSSAAKIIIDHLAKVVGDPKASSKIIVEAIRPVYGLTWTRAVLSHIGTSRINSILAKIRNSTCPRSEYDRVSTLWKQAFAVDTLFLPEWEEWKVIFERYRLDRRYQQAKLCEAISFLQAKGFQSPSDMSLISALDVEKFAPEFSPIALIRTVWRVIRLTFSQPSSSAHLIAAHENLTANKLFRAIKRCSEEGVLSNRSFEQQSKKFRLNIDFQKLGPLEKIKYLSKSSLPAVKLDRFIMDNTQLNLLKQFKGSLPPMASAVRNFSAFCELRKQRTFPPSEEMVIQWSSVFSNTATYYNYVQHLKNACIFLRLPLNWLTLAVKTIAKGLKKSQDKSFKFSNFIRSDLLLQIIEKLSMDSEFAQACMLSFLFAFRVPSETLSLVRAFKGDQLQLFSP